MKLFFLVILINLNSIHSFKLMEYAGATLQALEPINRLIRIRPIDSNSSCPGHNGMNGTCMYTIECLKAQGKAIGVCITGYMVRSCCKLPSRPTTTTTTTTVSTTTASTTIAPTITKASPSSLLSLNKQVTKVNLNENLLSEKLKNSQQQSSLSTQTSTPNLTTNKLLSTRLTSIAEQASTQQFLSTSTPKQKINSAESESITTTTTKPTTSIKLTDLQATNSPNIIDTSNDVLDVNLDNTINSISNEFNNEKIANQLAATNQTLIKTIVSQSNFTNEFTNLNSNNSNLVNNSISTSLPTQSTTLSILDSTLESSTDNQTFSLLEKKNVANQPIQEQFLVNNSSTLLLNDSLSVTTALPTTLKYVDLLKPLNNSKTTLSSSTTQSSIALSSDSTTEKSQSIETAPQSTTIATSNTTSHRIAIVYNPTTTTTSTTTTTITPLQSNETTSLSSIEPVNVKSICGKRLNIMPKGRIVGGTKSYFGEWPWMVSLRQWKKNAFLHKCGAALLNEYWAITAAHCIENIAATDLLLRLGEYDVSNDKEPFGYIERRVQIIASHPQFNPRTFEYDLALLRFYEKVPFRKNIIPVCIPEGNSSYVNKWATVTGWGRLYEDGPLPDLIQHVKMPIITNKECEQMYNQAGYIEDIPYIFICAGLAKGGRDSCEGDSGGPLVFEQDGRWNLIGIISWGIGCGVALQPGVYTRITEFTDWIHQIINF